MESISLVTGASGHLGNNLVRVLAANGQPVRAGIRNPAHRERLAGLGCEVVLADLLDKTSLVAAMQGVGVLYQVGAVFKHWAKDPEREIYQANMQATRNALQAAAVAGVKRVVYVSSLAALDRSKTPITATTWNPSRANVYFRSKTDTEQLAWVLAREHELEMVSVLPSAMIGANCFGLTPTMGIFQTILDRKLPVDPGFSFNFVDVADVAHGCWLAATRWRAGERYLLANENPTGVGEIVKIAQEMFAERNIKTPSRPPKLVLGAVVSLMERVARVRGVEPQLQRHFLTEFSVRETCDIAPARRDLGFHPAPPHEAIRTTFAYLAAANATASSPVPAIS